MPNIFERILRSMGPDDKDQGPPQHLFETRVTRTPGGIGSAGAGAAGGFDPKASPAAMVAAQPGLTEEEKAKLAQAWEKKGKGTIVVPQSSAESRPDVMKHEQIHALQERNRALLNQHLGEITGLVSPSAREMVETYPVYQQEAKTYGFTPTLADEGTAIDLATLPKGNQALYDLIYGLLGPEDRKQFQKLATGKPSR
jgi:hypothetical protein